MNLSSFKDSLKYAAPPTGIHELLKALWYDAKGDWESAHQIAQSREGTRDYDHLHAYLHRKEGDQWNAGYWYRRARVNMPTGPLEVEWENLVNQYKDYR